MSDEDVTSTLGRTDPEAELSLLGECLLDRKAIMIARGIVKPDDFADSRNGMVFDAILVADKRDKGTDCIDPGAVLNELRARDRVNTVGGAAFIMSLTDRVPTTAHVEEHARSIAECAVTRRMARECMAGIRRAADWSVPIADLVASVPKAISSAATIATGYRPKTSMEVASEIWDYVMDRADPTAAGGIPTLLRDLDDLIGAYYPKKLYLIAGRPGMGKSALGMLAARAAVAAGRRCLFFTLEMTARECMTRAACELANIDSQKLDRKQLTREEIETLSPIINELASWPILWDEDSRITPDDMRIRASLVHEQEPLGMMVCDYSQKIRARRDGNRHRGREGEVREGIEEQKAIAKDLNIAAVSLAQLNRDVEDRPNKRPMLSDLRESGSLEQEADVVMFPYRDEYYHRESADRGICEIDIGKQRGGRLGVVPVRFVPMLTKFSDLADEDKAAWKERRDAREGGRGSAKPKRATTYANKFANAGTEE